MASKQLIRRLALATCLTLACAVVGVLWGSWYYPSVEAIETATVQYIGSQHRSMQRSEVASAPGDSALLPKPLRLVEAVISVFRPEPRHSLGEPRHRKLIWVCTGNGSTTEVVCAIYRDRAYAVTLQSDQVTLRRTARGFIFWIHEQSLLPTELRP